MLANDSISIGFDPYAFLLAIVVALLAILEFRRNRAVGIQLIEATCGGTQALDENGAELFTTFFVAIRNIGIPLYDVMLVLHFRLPGMGGQASIPLRFFSQADKTGVVKHAGEFAYGMCAKFGLKSYLIDEAGRSMLASLKDVAEKDAVLAIYSHGYLAKQLRIGAGMDLVKFRWNQMAWRINPMFDSYVQPKDCKVRLRKAGRVLPELPSIIFNLQNFVRGVEAWPKNWRAQAAIPTLFKVPKPRPQGIPPSAK